MKLQNPQLKGGHYAPIHGISPDMIVTPLPFWLGSALKYVWRAPRKNGGEDFLKAADCLSRYANQLAYQPPQKCTYPGVIITADKLSQKIRNLDCIHSRAMHAVLQVVLWGSNSDPYQKIVAAADTSTEDAFSYGADYVLNLFELVEELGHWAQKIGDEDQVTAWDAEAGK